MMKNNKNNTNYIIEMGRFVNEEGGGFSLKEVKEIKLF